MDNLSLDCFIPSNLDNLDANVLFGGNLKNKAVSSNLNKPHSLYLDVTLLTY
jgi:hypothetical protein